MRKVIGIILILSLVISISSCGTKEEAKEEPVTQEKEELTVPEEIKEEKEEETPEEINNTSSTESLLYPFAENLEEVTMGELYKGSVYKYVTVKVPENYALYGQGVSANDEKYNLDSGAWGGRSLKEIKENEERYAEYQTAILNDIRYMGYNETEEELKHLFFTWDIIETKNRSGEEWDTTFEEDKAAVPGGFTIGSGTEHEAYFYDANIKPLEQSSSFTDDYYVYMMYKLNDEVYLGAVFYSDNLKKYSLEELSEAIYNFVSPIDSENAEEYTFQEEERIIPEDLYTFIVDGKEIIVGKTTYGEIAESFKVSGFLDEEGLPLDEKMKDSTKVYKKEASFGSVIYEDHCWIISNSSDTYFAAVLESPKLNEDATWRDAIITAISVSNSLEASHIPINRKDGIHLKRDVLKNTVDEIKEAVGLEDKLDETIRENGLTILEWSDKLIDLTIYYEDDEITDLRVDYKQW